MSRKVGFKSSGRHMKGNFIYFDYFLSRFLKKSSPVLRILEECRGWGGKRWGETEGEGW